METKLILQMLRKNWWIAALISLLAVFAALFYGFISTPTYQASARYLVAPNLQRIPEANLVNTLEALDKRSIVTTFAEFFNGRQNYLDVLHSLGLDFVDIEKKGYTYNTVILPSSNVMELIVSGPDPELVYTLVNDISKRAIDELAKLYPTFSINVIDPAILPDEPINPQPLRDSAIALVLGLIGGSAVAILSEQFRVPLNAYRERLRLDKASGVFNKSYFRRLVDDELAKPDNQAVSVALVQLGGLLEVTDALPPVAGEQLLTRIASILKGDLRGDDIVGRWSDSSFCLLMHIPKKAIQPTFERIRNSLKRPVKLDNYNEQVQFDPFIGIATMKPDASTNSLLARAEKALEKSRSGSSPIIVD